jgi:hypothetical protein
MSISRLNREIGGLLLGVCLTWLAALPAHAQGQIYRCGNEYTNNPGDAKARGCRPMEGGNLTIVESARPAPSTGAAPAGSSSGGQRARNASERVQADEQRARDNDARAILEAELRKAEARLTELRAEYNQGEPVKTPAELRNPKLYQDRLDDIKANLARAEADVEGIKRELARSTGGR